MKFRHEYKHVINVLDAKLIKSRLSTFLNHDLNSKEDGTYYIKSLYFDNYNDKALKEKIDGVNKREKFRIRYYNDDTTFIRLEKKSKVNGLCSKQSCAITKEQVMKILNNDIKFLIESDEELFNELYAKMHYQLLRPKNIVAYYRECFVYGPGNVRVTIDSDISGSYNVLRFLDSDLEMVHLYHNSILEVKWDEYLPDIVKYMVQLKNRKSSAFSKYAIARF